MIAQSDSYKYSYFYPENWVLFCFVFLTDFTGTLQRAIGETQSAWGDGAGKEDTIRLEEYYVQKDIRILDTRPFFEWDERALEECQKIMSGR